MNPESKWIWCKSAEDAALKQAVVAIFRKKIKIEGSVEEAKMNISAESHYKLYVNGKFVMDGPAKGDRTVWYYDQVDLKSLLVTGENVMTIFALHYPQNPAGSNQSLISSATPGIYGDGYVQSEGKRMDISSDRSYTCSIDTQRAILSESKGFAPLHIYEEYHANDLYNVTSIDFDDSNWEKAEPYAKRAIRLHTSPGNLLVRPVPYMNYEQGRFNSVMKGNMEEAFMKGTSIVIEANTKAYIELDASEETTAYYRLKTSGGKGASIEILQAENYYQEDGSKGDRSDCVHGHLQGYKDVYYPNGEDEVIYEPLWYRTFRFVRLTIETKDDALTIHDFDFMTRGYPLEVKSWVKTNDESLKDIWDISERTLRRCMQETYMDCPYYEQLQYVMDTRAQILYTYATAMDDRLARQALDDFRRSQRYDGMLCSAYPNTRPNTIPGFSIYYILMLHDHMMYFGDNKLIRNHMTAVENVLNYFEDHLTDKGLVGAVGDFFGNRFWSFIDWAGDWPVGVPKARECGSITMESLLYLLGLQKASELAEYIGYTQLANQYHDQAQALKRAIRKYCVGANGMIMDGPGYETYSQHCQVFAILTDLVDDEQGRKNLLETLVNPDDYALCSVSMALYLFEALRKSDLYEYTDKCWDTWRGMLKNHLTTCVESSEKNPRSDCHAWGALALYELPSIVLGVRPGSIGYKSVKIDPHPGYLTAAEGEVVTPYGMVKVSWTKENNQMKVNYEAPEGVIIE